MAAPSFDSDLGRGQATPCRAGHSWGRTALSLSLLGVVLLSATPVAAASRDVAPATDQAARTSTLEAPFGTAVGEPIALWSESSPVQSESTSTPPTLPLTDEASAQVSDAGAVLAPDPQWLATTSDAPLYADQGGTLLVGVAPQGTAFRRVAGGSSQPLVEVQDVYGSGRMFVAATALAEGIDPEQLALPSRWRGVVASEGANLRSAPSTAAEILGELPPGTPILVSEWVAGDEVVDDNPSWAMLADGAYVYSAALRPVDLPELPAPPVEAAGETERWIDLNLTHQVIVAYEGQTPVYASRTSTGRPEWETPEGVFAIQWRVADETMSSERLPGAEATEADYLVEHVRWTQYFSADGKALHENFWKPRDEIGIPSSHGCAGLTPENAQFFWDWASEGTPIYAHR